MSSETKSPIPPDNEAPKWTPKELQWWRTIPMGLTFILIAVASEVILVRSDNSSGFDLPLTNATTSRGIQFAKSFVPSMILHLVFLWFIPAYDAIKLIQPYVNMSEGVGAMASKSVLLNYSPKGPFSAFRESFKNGHFIVCIFSLLALAAGVFSSLAASYFQIVSLPQSENVIVDVAGNVGLGYANLTNTFTPYIAAAGGLDNAIRTGVLISPYLLRRSEEVWMVPTFTPTNSTPQGGEVLAELSAATVQTRCAPAKSNITILDRQGDWEIVGTLPNVNGCNATSYAPNATIGTWFGWAVPAPFACVQAINPGETDKTDPGAQFYPLAFSFVKTTSIYSMVFCYSTVVEHNVVATLTLGNETSTVSDVADKGVAKSLGFTTNGISFGNPTNDGRISGISDAIIFALTDAIMTLAGSGGVVGAGINASHQDEILGSANLTAPLAQTANLLFQAFVSPWTLVVGSKFQQHAVYKKPVYRLIADNAVAHTITALCALTGVILILLFTYHHERRPEIRLGAEPSSLGALAAILPGSRLAETAELRPSDSIEDIDDKLKPFRFQLVDGVIEVERHVEGQA